MKVLVIEDSQRLRRSLRKGLRAVGYSVDLVADGGEGLDYARLNTYDVIVLDIMLPTVDGLTVLRGLRDLGNQTSILILSAKDGVGDRIRGLQLGADDYLIKPFAFDELCARINTLVRRRYGVKNPDVVIGPITLNTSGRFVRRHGSHVRLTSAEYAILEILALNRGRVLSKERLLEAIHDSDSYTGTNVIEVLICKLRRKIGCARGDPIVRTRRGYGYWVE